MSPHHHPPGLGWSAGLNITARVAHVCGVRHWTQHLAGIIPFNPHQILLSGHRDYPHFADEGNCVFRRTRELAQEHTLVLQLPDLA